MGKVGGHPAAWASDPQIMAFLGTILRYARAEVSVWWLAWTVAMDDDGKLVVDLRGQPVASGPGWCAAVSRPGIVFCGGLDGRDPEKYSGVDETGEWCGGEDCGRVDGGSLKRKNEPKPECITGGGILRKPYPYLPGHSRFKIPFLHSPVCFRIRHHKIFPTIPAPD